MLKKWQSRQYFFSLLTGSEWGIEDMIASALGKGLKQSLLLGLQTVWDFLYIYDNSHYLLRLQVFRCELFELLSVFELTLSERYERYSQV
jgi:hypothetical protein